MTLDIIIPVLNEIDHLPQALASLRQSMDRAQLAALVRVVDGGSVDGSIAAAQETGTTVLACPTAGRGSQIAAGVEQGSGDWILILHADTAIEPDALARLGQAINTDPALEWGVLGHRYDEATVGLWMTSVFNRLRFNILGLGYGDQGIFVKRAPLDAVGGVPRQPLMEDVELSRQLHGRRRLFLGNGLVASARQWRRRGFWPYTIGNLRLTRAYLKRRRDGEPAERIAREMYEVYYGG